MVRHVHMGTSKMAVVDTCVTRARRWIAGGYLIRVEKLLVLHALMQLQELFGRCGLKQWLGMPLVRKYTEKNTF